ncbi:F-box/kelch-repeat protein [Trifolium repens]|nr:F-box/kelch-repeat protein [Trifolium repens]
MVDKTSAVNNQHSPSLSSVDHAPSLPLDLVEEEILPRLPVKLLVQIRCVCKSWNSLISNLKFAKKHLLMSTTRRLYFLGAYNPFQRNMITSCPLQSVYTTVSTKLEYPPDICRYSIVGSCNGILCVVHDAYSSKSSIQLWNPSIRKVRELPPFGEPPHPSYSHNYGFGYDSVTDNYKVVVVSFYRTPDDEFTDKTEVKVNTLGTNFWKNMQEFPFGTPDCIGSGTFVSGTINWVASKHWHESPCFIVSLDLGKESFRKVLLPDLEEVDASMLYLSVLRDCLCMTYDHDVWIMKDYGNKESWTKLFTVSYMRDPSKSYDLTEIVYMFEDGQVLLQTLGGDWYSKLILYDPRIGTFKFIEFQNNNICDPIARDGPKVCIESLISPCSF